MKQTDIKHIDELGKASRIIRELGYEPDKSMCEDRPDIVLPSKTDRHIQKTNVPTPVWDFICTFVLELKILLLQQKWQNRRNGNGRSRFLIHN